MRDCGTHGLACNELLLSRDRHVEPRDGQFVAAAALPLRAALGAAAVGLSPSPRAPLVVVWCDGEGFDPCWLLRTAAVNRSSPFWASLLIDMR
jgi:hypothetical protein